MKVAIPEELKGKELYTFLVENKSALITQKKSLIKKCDPITSSPSYFTKEETSKAASAIPTDATSFVVKVVANTAMYMDSQKDVLLPECWNKSIADRQGMVPHLHDHIHEIGAEVGDVKKFYSQDINLSDLGINQRGFAKCLIFETTIQKEYNSIVFNKYKNGKPKQHSISLQYIKIGMAINDEDYVAEFDLWNKHYPDIINKDDADEAGYFWVVPEIKVIENSLVLFGSNQITPLLYIRPKRWLELNGEQPKNDTLNQPLQDTEEKPLQKTMVACNTCDKFFYSQEGEETRCPDCGQYQSLSNHTIELSTFDLMKAIEETTFITI